MTSIAIILVDLNYGRFGHAADLLFELGSTTVLQHTINRVARIDGLDGIVLLHPEGQSLAGLYEAPAGSVKAQEEVMQQRADDGWLRSVIDSGRKWALTAWRGGIGGMTIYDELMPAYPLLSAMRACEAESAVVVRGDWCCVDPALASEQLGQHRSAPEAMKLIFTQAPPGLSPLIVHHSVLEDMVEHSATIANLICYNPKKPAIDPVGKDVNVQVPASVRDQYRRFIFDTPRAIDHLKAVADQLGDAFSEADAMAITDASRAVELEHPEYQLERLPQQINVELSPRRPVDGPIVPQHYLDLGRAEMSTEMVDSVLEQLPAGGDTSVLFGGLGDALLHDDWYDIIERATRSGLLGVGIETDLLAETETITRLSKLPIDVIAVRINADTAQTYEKLMGSSEFGHVIENMQSLFKFRNGNRQNNTGFQGWVVPRLVKVGENLKDLETFFERWMTVCGWVVVDRALTGRGLIPEMGPVPMEVPRPADRPPELHRIKQRLTVLSDGTVCLCGQDWLGRLPLGRLDATPLSEMWRDAGALADRLEQEDTSPICPACVEWLEAQKALVCHA